VLFRQAVDIPWFAMPPSSSSTSRKYLQSKQESVALLKLVIAEMSQHDAPLNPATFAVWYEYLAGINPRLTESMDLARKEQPRLSAEVTLQLFLDHVADADEGEQKSAREDLQRVMREVARSAAETGQSARAYGTQLAGLSRALVENEQTPDAAALTPRLSEVADGTAHMQSTVAALEQSLAHGEREITRLREALERARVEAVTDALSQLLNRKGFDDTLREVLSSLPPAGLDHCLVVLDLDHFKRINDTYGHPVGDNVIAAVGQVLARGAEGPDLFTARIGGEEFAVIMRSTTPTQALQMAEKVRGLVRAMKLKKRGTQEVIATVTVSAGVATWVPGDDAESLLAAADAALYRAKAAGRDRVAVS
jgi:diguanylate cyclase